jgi:uncharacterized protein involved in outer membrane biogenesis
VEIRGDIRVVPALWPTLGVQRVRVGQLESFPGAGPYFARFERARGQIDLFSLLRGEIRIGELEIAGAHLALETSTDGRNNWAFGADASKPAGSDAAGPALLEIRALELDEVEVTYWEGSTSRDYRLDIDALAGSLDPDELKLSVEGTAGRHGISLDLRADELGELRRGYEPWELEVEGLVAAIPLTGRADGELDWPRSGGAPAPRVRLHVETLHTEAVRANLATGREAGRADSPGLTIECPIPPERISIRDVDLGVRMDRVRLRPTDLTDVAFSARIRDSSVESAPFRAHYAGVDFRGELDLSLAEEAPAAALRVATDSLDVGNLARALGFAADLEARAARFALNLGLKGRTGRELLTFAAF